MKELTVKQKESYRDYHEHTHRLRALPSLKLLSIIRNRALPVIKERITRCKEKGYLTKFNFCPYCGKKLV